MAHISDSCNHLQRSNIHSAYYTSINTDNLSIPKQFTNVLQNYVSTIATITPTTMQNDNSEGNRQSLQKDNSKIQMLFNMEKNSSFSNVPSQVSSFWEVHVERDFSKDFLLRTNPLGIINQFKNQQLQHQPTMVFQTRALYAIIWTYDQYHDPRDIYQDSDDEDVDFDAKEILWRLL